MESLIVIKLLWNNSLNKINMSIKIKLRNFLIGKPVDGKDIINITPKFRTVYPDRKYSFNEISQNIRKNLAN